MVDVSGPVTLRSSQDILGMVPYLLGYHPTDRVAAIYVRRDNRVLAHSVIDLAAPTDVIVDGIRDIAIRARAQTVILVGYGPLTAAGAVIAAADGVHRHVPVRSTLFVSVGCYYCLNPGCTCDAVTGLPFDPKTTAVAAASTVRGLVALPSRSDLLALAEPDPVAQRAVHAAIRRLRVAEPDPAGLRDLLEVAMLDQRLTDEQAARLAILLRDRRVRDDAWSATEGHMWQRNLWLDLTRRVPDCYVTAPAALAAWCAWMRGEHTLALAAARRALAAGPRDMMTTLIVTAIHARIPASDLVGNWPPADTDPVGVDRP